jgi:hypothetical protein
VCIVVLLGIVVILFVFVLLCVCVCVRARALLVFIFFTLVAGLLARSQYSEGPATDHLDTCFPWFPCVYKRMLSSSQDSKFPLHASHVALPT